MTAVGRPLARGVAIKFADAESRSDPEIPAPEILRLGVACAGVRGVSVHAVPRLPRAQRVRGPPLRAAGAHLCPAARAACRAAHCAAGRGAGIARSRLPRRAARRRVRLVRAQRQRTGDRAAAVRVLGRAPAGEAPARGVRRRCGHGAARRRGRGAAARAPGAVADRRHLPGEQRGPGAGQARRGAATFRAGPDRHRGPPVLLPQRLRPARPRARGAEPRVRQGPGRQHAHPAARQKLLPDSGAYAAARATELGVTRKPAMGTSPYPAFLRLVHRQMRRDYDEADLRSEGLRIFTTLDPRVQRAAESALIRRLAQFDKEHRFGEPGLEGAVVVTDPQSGEVQALVGGRDVRYQGYNRAIDAVRPVGSLLKPAIYLTALSEPSRYTLLTPIDDGPFVWKSRGAPDWEPANYDRKFHGAVPLRVALAQSYNVATARLGTELGVERVLANVRRLGGEREVQPFALALLGAPDRGGRRRARLGRDDGRARSGAARARQAGPHRAGLDRSANRIARQHELRGRARAALREGLCARRARPLLRRPRRRGRSGRCHRRAREELARSPVRQMKYVIIVSAVLAGCATAPGPAPTTAPEPDLPPA